MIFHPSSSGKRQSKPSTEPPARFINGSSVADGSRTSDVWNPSDGEVQATVALGTADRAIGETLEHHAHVRLRRVA